MTFKNKTVLVTGGNSGIGLTTAQRFAKEGAKVVICGRDKTSLELAAKENNLIAIQCDVANMAELDKLYKEVNQKVGKIDVLFANAGIYKTAPLEQTTESLFDEVMSINLKGLFFSVQKALPYLNDGASIVLTSSVLNHKAWPGNSIYSATKAAVRSLARSFAVDLLPRKIRVNTVSPGPTFTPIFGRLGLPEAELQTIANQVLESIPLKRFGSSEDIANAVLFLASDASSFMTGGDVEVDGGLGQI